MAELSFRAEDIEELHRLRYSHPHPRVQKRMEVLLLKSKRLAHETIADIAGVTPRTVDTYVALFRKKRIDGLKQLNFRKPESKLIVYRDTLENYFRENPPSTIAEALNKIESITGLRRSPTQARNFLRQLGLRCRKVGTIPAKADAKKQQDFLTDKLNPRIEEAKAGRRTLLFVDAAHFVRGAFLGFIWCFTKLFVRGPSGRERLNVLGALNAVTREITMVTNDTYINANSVCELLTNIRGQYAKGPVSAVLDNARYQKCALVQDLAKSLDIELLYLPSYSPNLNLIERLWKFVKKECLYSKHYNDFKGFKAAILECLNKADTEHRSALASLLTLRFQTFDYTKILPV